MDEIREDWLGPLEERLEKEFHFTVLDHRLDFHGICYRCRDKKGDTSGNDDKKS
ncbi:hypothetical protein D3C76_1789910 [compost metagenome]